MELLLLIHAESISEPGANMSRHVPKFEYDARTSVRVVAPTVNADTLLLAGDVVHASTFAFPAATTTVIPSAYARSIAEFKESLFVVPRLRFITAGLLV